MSYFLGIDLGTTYTAAAVCRDGKPEIARLGSRTPAIPSVVLLRESGEVLTGEAAERRSVTEPERIAREFKRRFGDPTPMIVGGTPWSADALTAKVLGAVVAQVSEVEGQGPDGIVVAHPANWGDYKKDLLHEAIRLAGLGGVSFISEPEAAAIHYASQERIRRGSVVAVYDLGGGTFDAAVLRRTDFGWKILGRPEGVEHLGGVDFDEAVFTHVADNIGDDFDLLDPDDPAVLSAVARLRHECVEGKEALAADTDVAIPVLLPSTRTQMEVRLTRSELEEMIRPSIADSIAALERALRSAGVTADDVTSVLLVGGSSRMPLVAEMVGSVLGRPVAVDAHPKHGVALGASIVADERGALAALTAAGQAATAAAASVAALASVRGATGEGGNAGGTAGTGDDLTTALDGTQGNGFSRGGSAGSGGSGGTGTVAAGPVPPGEWATPRDQPLLTPDSGAGYPGMPSGAYRPTGYEPPPRRPSSGGHRITPRRRSPLRDGIVLGSLCVMILAAAATLFAYRNRGDDHVFDSPPTTEAPSGQVTTTSDPSSGDDDQAESPFERPGTSSTSSTTAAPSTTAPTRTTTQATTPSTTAPPSTSPSTTTPPTSETTTTTLDTTTTTGIIPLPPGDD